MNSEINSDTTVLAHAERPLKIARILIAGGYGLVGSFIARHIRELSKDVEIILAGRNPEQADPLVGELGNARTAYLDVQQATDLSELGPIDLIVASLHDRRDLLLQWALDRGIAHIGITKMVEDMAPVTFLTLQTPPKRPVVLLGHWQAGPFSPVAQKAIEQFSHIRSVEATALYDTRDPIGPMVVSELDSFVGRALLRENGEWKWVDAKQNARLFRLEDGAEAQALPMATLDVPSLAAITGAPHVRFDFAMGDSIGTRAGKKASHDLYLDIEGTLLSGAQAKQRIVVSNPEGVGHFTALGVLIAIEYVLGLGGVEPASGALHLPETLIPADKAIDRYRQFGVTISQSLIHE
jgi:hypothetical protein